MTSRAALAAVGVRVYGLMAQTWHTRTIGNETRRQDLRWITTTFLASLRTRERSESRISNPAVIATGRCDIPCGEPGSSAAECLPLRKGSRPVSHPDFLSSVVALVSLDRHELSLAGHPLTRQVAFDRLE